jgi:large subunit ribosomal protein L25
MSAATATRPSLAAQPREISGKRVAVLRRAGQLPGVVFGHGLDSTSVSVDAHDFELLRRRTGQNALVDLSIGDEKPQPVLIHGVQVHPVTRRPLHVDLFLVRMTEELTVDVPLVSIGQSTAVETDGGTLLHALESVRVKALPDHLPQSIEYSIESLVDFDTTIHVRDLEIPSDVTLLTDPDEVVAKVQAPRVEVEEEPVVAEGEEAEEAEAEGEGEAAETGAGEPREGSGSEG